MRVLRDTLFECWMLSDGGKINSQRCLSKNSNQTSFVPFRSIVWAVYPAAWLLLSCLLAWERVSPGHPGWPGTHITAQDGVKLGTFLLPQPPGGWDYRHVLAQLFYVREGEPDLVPSHWPGENSLHFVSIFTGLQGTARNDLHEWKKVFFFFWKKCL